MPNACPNILLLEDTRTVQNYIRDVLRALPHEHRLLCARKVEEARLLAADNEVDLFIVDIGLPDGNGIDFLCEMALLQPNARALIITATPSEHYRDRAQQIGVLNFLPKPLQRKSLFDNVSRLLELSPTGAVEEEASGFEATLGGLAPADIIQLKCLGRATGVVEFNHEDCTGLVWFTNGEVTHAECSNGHHQSVGLEAFQTIVHWRSGTVHEVLDPPPDGQTIGKSWQSLLLDAGETAPAP